MRFVWLMILLREWYLSLDSSLCIFLVMNFMKFMMNLGLFVNWLCRIGFWVVILIGYVFRWYMCIMM